MILTTPSQRRALLRQARTIAIVGASANPLRPSYTVFSYLRRQPEYDVTPINPGVARIDGINVYPSLVAYAAERGAPPDLIDVFRRPNALVGVVTEAIEISARAIWFQYGLVNEEAIRLADAAGMIVVVDRCVKVEHARFSGGLSTSGLNSGVITSRRRSGADTSERS